MTPSPASTSLSQSIPELCQDLVENHHEYIRAVGPALLRQAVDLGPHDTRADLPALILLLRTLLRDLDTHMLKEEAILFPYCQRLASATEAVSMHCGNTANPIRAMDAEHKHCQSQLITLARLTDNYTPAAGSSAVYAGWLEQLKLFAEDLKIHIYKEDQLLFPLALARDAELRGADMVS
ncbi:MAG: hemerythrin domain-containing protein [Candidatus Sericytochromatia bacterium]|nr:hemerythrin domain-containing protein [Candidatus Sericytochromatia bacterium]